MARGVIEATVQVDGLKQLDRDLKRLAPDVEKELKGDMRDIAQDIARKADGRVNARSFSYRGTATGTRAAVRSTGPRAFVALFLEDGFHPRGGSTLVPGQRYVGRVIEENEDRIVDRIGDAVEKAARNAGFH